MRTKSTILASQVSQASQSLTGAGLTGLTGAGAREAYGMQGRVRRFAERL